MFSVHVFMRIFQWFTTLFVWLLILSIFISAWFYADLPDIDKAIKATRQPTIKVFSADGEILASRGKIYGLPTSASDVPASLLNAILATEDRRFYSHYGVDLIALFRAAWVNFKAGRIRQGGSTITQQVAKNLFLSPARSLKRKIQEVMLSFWLEYKFSKKQILTIYLNRVYFGSGAYGVDAASRLYFGVPVSHISTYQSALLAGLLKAPSRYNPKANKKKAHTRARQVLNNMVAAGYLSRDRALKIQKKKINNLKTSRIHSEGHFTDWILNEVFSFVSQGNRDLEVITTLDLSLQREAQAILSRTINQFGKKKNIGNGAIIIMTPSGAILAMVGGQNYKNSQFNRVTQARRQPGSVFKPIVYLSALEAGLTPNSLILDSPIKIANWKPENFDKKYRGPVALKEALSQSINTVAVRIAKKVGPNRIKETAKRLGIVSDLPSDLSIALGTSELTLMEMTSAYAPFANGGFGVLAYGIKQVRSSSGRLLYSRGGSGPGRVISETQVTNMNTMLTSVLASGTGKKARLPIPAGGKTGTSQNYRDAWFLGYTSNLVTGVWLGNDDSSPMKSVTGGGLPAKIWKDVMKLATARVSTEFDKRSYPNNNPEAKSLYRPFEKSGFLKFFLEKLGNNLN